MKAFLILEDGTVFSGTSIGSAREVVCEIVFNTSMTGYLEVLTEPAYAGQAVVMTYPLIGNYGICHEDQESLRPWAEGLIVRELSRIPSNFRSEATIQDFLEANDIPGIAGIDTRALTKLLRQKGTMNGMITTEAVASEDVLKRIREFKARDLVPKVTCQEKKVLEIGGSRKVAVIDFGLRNYIIEALQSRGCELVCYPADTTATEILADRPDGILLSDGPGDPKDCQEFLPEIRKLFDSGIPLFALGLGHQLTALTAGADTYRLPYGHRGGNQPVKDLKTGRVYITEQNHGYAVVADSLPADSCETAFVNVNDGTIEGLSYRDKNILTVQFYPVDGAAGIESGCLFDYFMKMMGGNL